MSNACVETLSQQASPMTVLRHSLAAICGHSNTREVSTKGLSFFEEGSTTAKFMNCMFRLPSNAEGVSHNCNHVELKNHLTLNNLYPWYPFKQRIKTDVKIALIPTWFQSKWLTIVQAFPRRWLQETRPLVTIALGEQVLTAICSRGKESCRLGDNG